MIMLTGTRALALTCLFANCTFSCQGPCIGRETLYAGGYLGLCPMLYDMLKAKAGFSGRSMR